MNLEPIALRELAHCFAVVCAVPVPEVLRAGVTRAAGSLGNPAWTIIALVTGLAVGMQVVIGDFIENESCLQKLVVRVQ